MQQLVQNWLRTLFLKVLLLQGGSESWFTESNVAIASLAFHPTAQLLLIATNNELHFWDWSRPEPFAVVKTGSDTERVRWVGLLALLRVLAGGPVHKQYKDLYFLRYELVVHCNTGVYAAFTTFGSPHCQASFYSGLFCCAAFECPWNSVKSEFERANWV